jgi:glycosyltransferase involved in cell wall biosynthesis
VKKEEKLRIFIGLSETSGYYSNLNKGFQELGQDSVFVNLGGNKHYYDEEIVDNPIVRLCKYSNAKWREQQVRKGFAYFVWKLLFLIVFPMVFIWSFFRFDVFIFTGTRSFLNYYDFPILRIFGKKVIKVSLGSFTRQAYIDGTQVHGSYSSVKPSTVDLINMARKQKKLIDRVDRNVDLIIDHLPQASLHNKEFVSLLNIGIPFSTEKFSNSLIELNPDKNINRTRILHAPSYSVHKGTLIIREIINELKEEGYNIDYIEISNMPNEVVLEEIQKSDFVIDEMFSDSPMATFAAEAAYFGKPTIVGGYFANSVREYYSEESIPPSLFCHPDEVKEAIIKLIKDKDFRLKLGEDAQKYVLEEWNPKNVALKFMRLIAGDIPNAWLFESSEIRYLHGYGLTESHLKKVITDMINIGGIESLQLHHNPELEKLYYELSHSLIKQSQA